MDIFQMQQLLPQNFTVIIPVAVLMIGFGLWSYWRLRGYNTAGHRMTSVSCSSSEAS